MLKLELQYFGLLMQRIYSLEKTLMLEKIEGNRRKGGWLRWRKRWLDTVTDSMDMNLRKLWEIVKSREAWHVSVHGVANSQTWLSDWTTAAYFIVFYKTHKIKRSFKILGYLEVISQKLGEGNGTPLQYSCLENPMGGEAWLAAVHGVAESQTWLSNFTFMFHFHALAKEMATHSSVLAWRIPGTGEPGGLLSMGSHRVGHDWLDLAAAVAAVKNYRT